MKGLVDGGESNAWPRPGTGSEATMHLPRPPRRTVRLRLTTVYSGLFLVSGVALLAITYLLMTGRIVGGQLVFTRRVDNGQDAPRPEHTPLRGSDPTQLHQFLTLAGIALG